jgi:hypothetical protein
MGKAGEKVRKIAMKIEVLECHKKIEVEQEQTERTEKKLRDLRFLLFKILLVAAWLLWEIHCEILTKLSDLDVVAAVKMRRS